MNFSERVKLIQSILVLPFILVYGVVTWPLRELSRKKKGWKVALKGRSGVVYSEYRNGVWDSIDIDGEMLASDTPGYVVYLRSEEEWSEYPSWVSGRRKEIVNRLKEDLPPPEFEYQQ